MNTLCFVHLLRDLEMVVNHDVLPSGWPTPSHSSKSAKEGNDDRSSTHEQGAPCSDSRQDHWASRFHDAKGYFQAKERANGALNQAYPHCNVEMLVYGMDVPGPSLWWTNRASASADNYLQTCPLPRDSSMGKPNAFNLYGLQDCHFGGLREIFGAQPDDRRYPMPAYPERYQRERGENVYVSTTNGTEMKMA
ncbi:hypothetical protein SODALDRAFT_362762 [Sodiomyces alkalinus F11]|uniref:Uncharacterized protein n=1 Tax=Sodiomyces alkalinus (strain CBS 110278 / VKM F-3762 / F11) TaxID=1314773 RepID=A0A3N2PMZ9_SODAK|nr:hypothetical protein SODALDRAFT_362762 [Sodiomyces alkalinus F11]ROT35911.1 hypothetical protein SODALDRAFT_362762 [Sodiomyces alkalinus F11]